VRWTVVALGVLAGAPLLGCGGGDTATAERTNASGPRRAAASLLTVHPVVRDAGGQCSRVPVRDDQQAVPDPELPSASGCLLIDAPVLDATEVATAEVMPPDPSDAAPVAVRLEPAGARDFEVALRDVGARLVILFRGEPVSAPTIHPGQAPDGLVVTGLTPTQAEELVRGVAG
jgi:preprotein translocase subunit SecD